MCLFSPNISMLIYWHKKQILSSISSNNYWPVFVFWWGLRKEKEK